MSRALFLDTSAWLSVLNLREQRHDEALHRYEGELQAGSRFITTNLVLAEMHVLLTRHRRAGDALRFVDAVHRDLTHEVRHVDRDLVLEAIDRWLRPFTDHLFSLADAVSFEVMRREQLTVAFTLDKHFQTAGFQTVP